MNSDQSQTSIAIAAIEVYQGWYSIGAVVTGEDPEVEEDDLTF